jgi:hypothetical protein
MKVLLAIAALATLVSSSAHAQYGLWQGDYRAYPKIPPYAAYSLYGVNTAYAQVPRMLPWPTSLWVTIQT